MREGHLLPILISILISLMTEMYTTKYDPQKNRIAPDLSDGHFIHNKQRGGNTITDFWTCKGEVEVKDSDTLGYFIHYDCELCDSVDFYGGQDPKTHYWIYLKTLREEFVLELSMFTINVARSTDGADYVPKNLYTAPEFHEFPGFLITREMRQTTGQIHHERERFSILHDTTTQNIVRLNRYNKVDQGLLVELMEKVAGKLTHELEQDLLISWISRNRDVLASNLFHREYLQYTSSIRKECCCGVDCNSKRAGGNLEEQADW
ncbi:hypothetical protein AN958_02567 [Leucoagaricus sp. SymC.cos]|nr:hypothetical protein AN958_02567 [Leucoagaricus sp. SymC.cos]